jgi:6-phosphogluconolactonase
MSHGGFHHAVSSDILRTRRRRARGATYRLGPTNEKQDILLCQPRTGLDALQDRCRGGVIGQSRHGDAARKGAVCLAASSAPFLYVGSSNGGASSLGVKGDKHYLSALRIDPDSGELQAHGAPAALRSRPIHVNVDHTGTFALVAYNNPSSVSVHRINADGVVGEEVKQAASLDCGIFAHQIRVTPDNSAAILVCRGNDAAKDKPEDPGALKLFGFKDGQLTNRISVAPNGGHGFGPRHLDFHPSLPLVYVSRERENKLDVYRLSNGVLDGQRSL